MAALNQSILANSAPINNVEVYVSNSSFAVSNTVGNGNSWIITMAANQYTSGEKIGPVVYKLKYGANGNVADSTVLSVYSLRDIGDITPIAAQFVVTLRANSAGNVQPILAVTGYELGTNKNAVNTAVVAVNGSSTGYANSATGWYLGTSFSGGDSVSNVVFSTVVITPVLA
jgi:hypothetical protein